MASPAKFRIDVAIHDLLMNSIPTPPSPDRGQLTDIKKTCQRHCFSTLNHNLAYCYNDARVIKWLWKRAKNGFQDGARSFDD